MLENLSETYLDRCVSACNIYVDTFNTNMASLIQQGVIQPLDNSIKVDRFKSMTGKQWDSRYEGYRRPATNNKQSLNEWLMLTIQKRKSGYVLNC